MALACGCSVLLIQVATPLASAQVMVAEGSIATPAIDLTRIGAGAPQIPSLSGGSGW